jgi:hypothetical protein
VKAGPPAVAELGLSEPIAGGALIANATPLEATPPDTTLTVASPLVAIRSAETEAVRLPALTNVVGKAEPFHRTTAPCAKLLPLTVKVKAGPPAVAEPGFKLVIAGAGLTVNDSALVVVPPESTVTDTLPAAAIKLAGTAAVSCVALPNVVVSAVPFHCTTAPVTKLLPPTVSVNPAPPAVAELGLSEAIVGGGGLIVKGNPLVVTPPESTVTVALPGLAINVAGTVAVS